MLFSKLLLLSSFTMIMTCLSAQQPKVLSSVFADHMVLQRDLKVPVWGTGNAGENVNVQFAGQKRITTVENNGKWRVDLMPMPASFESRDMDVTVGRITQKLSDILVGDVWLCSGQSNMEMGLGLVNKGKEEIAAANHPAIRLLWVPNQCSAQPLDSITGVWKVCSPESITVGGWNGFSAVAYFFSRELNQKINVPIGVIEAAWGGTPIETWISFESLKQEPAINKAVDVWGKAMEQHQKVLANPKLATDYANNIKQWQEVVLPAFEAAKKAYNDSVKAGLTVGAKPQLPYSEPVNPDPMGYPNPSKRPSTPTVNYNAMIAPLIPYAIRGVVWYQGEANGNAGVEYRALLPRLINDWRSQWNQPQIPFIYAQLPCYGADATPVAEKGWPWLREAQLMSLKVSQTGMATTIDIGNPKNIHPTNKSEIAKRLALVARKVAYNENIVASGPLFENFSIEKEGKIRIRFRETGSGLAIGQSPWYAPGVPPFPKDTLIGFFIAGADKKWIQADAVIDGTSVVVSSPQVPEPTAVRYGWANSPRCNLYNKEGLPAAPFRTDMD